MVILNQSVIHYSPPNKSDKIRLAIATGVQQGRSHDVSLLEQTGRHFINWAVRNAGGVPH